MNGIKCSSSGCNITKERCKSVPSPSHLIRHKETKLYVENFTSQRKSTGQQLHKDRAGPHLTPSGYCLRNLRCPTCGTPRSKINASSPWNPKSHLRERNGSKEQDGLFRFSSVQMREACLLLHRHKGSLLEENIPRALVKLLQFYLFAC